ncbi:adenosylcobinamide-phosphate synthase CbiB [Sphingobium abikonense]|uniref:adenosylcobinamide-phosphate synthase CbiB n=1 Tax=Sphingobium abikonense TaxID=86193 RepID=UPI003512C127
MVEPAAMIALILDAGFGWPERLYRRVGHPIGRFAHVIEGCERRWNLPSFAFGKRRAWGVATLILLLGAVIGVTVALTLIVEHLIGQAAWIGLGILAWPALAQRSLFQHVRAVAAALHANSVPKAREAVGAIVGRDTDRLDEAGISRAAIESLAESFCDGVVAPLFWLLLLGLPGVWAYKAINTADSLIGHREERWRAFGWAAARIDDVANLIPARLSALLLCLAGGGGWCVLWRDAGRHASPNAGWPEAAMAGALGLRLAGPVAYDGELSDKPWINAEGRSADGRDIDRALRSYISACMLLWVITAATILAF